MKTIVHHLRVHASAADIFEALTTSDGLASWWTTHVDAEPRDGGRVRFTFRGDFHPVMEVTRFEPASRVAWTCVGGHDNWAENRFDFALNEVEDGETDVHFRQEYAQELDDATYGTYNFNWGYYLNSLKQSCETGNGTPYEASAP